MEKEYAQVQVKAKKHKKLFEEVIVNPFAYEVNENLYFQVVYKNRKGKITGSAIMAVTSDSEDEARKANKPLTLYCATVSGLLRGGRQRATQSPEIMNPLIDALSNEPDPEIRLGVEKIIELREWHRRFNKVYGEAETNFAGGLKTVTEEDLKFLVERTAHLEVIHDEIVRIMSEDIPLFEEWRKNLKKKGLWGRLTEHSKGFIYQLIKDRKKAEQLRAAALRIEGNTYDERVAYVRKRIDLDEEEVMQGHKKELRWPKM
ncbi:hypothetical protein [Jeotgalibacillus sp. R-1-5s-1]|uniref:hypothetical protein n=1 Tax=Jeotgalibacillus sp. R-1-5s-1 TaxID=2555897 RepID=UPI00106D0AB6|nr:hypothetical protein [Jeotgalibacillus sp. R-1-5s-1]TFD99393.1 hypothetical protein E2491_08015 [Jeotgalibacillus sp. R-1-5s-1]